MLSSFPGHSFHLSHSLASAGFAAAPKGTIKGAHPQYVSSTSVQITSGYGEINGDWWEIAAPTTYSLVNLSTTEGWEYIYIHDAASSYPTPTITNNSVAPTRVDAKQGYYDGFNRCIGVLWRPGGSAIIAAFHCTPDGKYVVHPGGGYLYVKRLISSGNPTGGVSFLEATAYSPVNCSGLLLDADNTDTDSLCQVQIGLWDNSNYGLHGISSGQVYLHAWIPVHRGSSRDFFWIGHDDDDNNYRFEIRGWEIER